MAFHRRVYAGTRRTVRRRARLVAVRLPESTKYRFYLTNIDPDSLDAQSVAQTYAARCQIELIFKELKSHYRLDELHTSKAHIVETILVGAVITLLVSRRLLQAVRERLRRTDTTRCPSSVGLHWLLEPQRRSLTSLCCRRGCRELLPGASNRCCFMRGLTHIGRADSSPSASNPVPLGPNSVHFNPLTDHQCREPRDGSVPELHPSLFLTGTVG